MYTRGQLVLICNIGRKAIRLYEEEGIICSKIDQTNGYHYYDDEQIKRLNTIKRYKKLGLSINEIKNILCEGIAESTILSQKKDELENQIKKLQNLCKDLEQSYIVQEQVYSNEISIGYFDECVCVAIEENVDLEKLGISVGKLHELAVKNSLKIVGAHFVKYEGTLENGESFKMTTCLPIQYSNDCNVDMQLLRRENRVKCIYVNFTGGFSKVGNEHRRINEYIIKEKLDCTGTVYEIYNTDMSVDIYYELK